MTPLPTSVLCGLGTSLPTRTVSNQQLIDENDLDSNDRWILDHTGIANRRIADTTSTGDLACAAGRAALDSAAELAGAEILPDIVLLATSTPDYRCPATAPEVAHRLGLDHVPAMDIAAVCSGFVYALTCARALVAAGLYSHPLVIGADTFTSTLIDPHDRNTAVLFGDGAGAVLIRPGTSAEPGALLAEDLGSDGSHTDFFRVPAGGSRLPFGSPGAVRDKSFVTMDGVGTFTHAVRRMSASARAVLELTGWSAAEVEAFISHQANQRIIDAVADRLSIPGTSRHGNLRDVGNTAAASIPLALADTAERRLVEPGARTLITGFGAGLVWGAHTLNFPEARPRAYSPKSDEQS